MVQRDRLQRLRLSRSAKSHQPDAEDEGAGLHLVLFHRLRLGNVFDAPRPNGIGRDGRHVTARVDPSRSGCWRKNLHHAGWPGVRSSPGWQYADIGSGNHDTGRREAGYHWIVSPVLIPYFFTRPALISRTKLAVSRPPKCGHLLAAVLQGGAFSTIS